MFARGYRHLKTKVAAVLQACKGTLSAGNGVPCVWQGRDLQQLLHSIGVSVASLRVALNANCGNSVCIEGMRNAYEAA